MWRLFIISILRVMFANLRGNAANHNAGIILSLTRINSFLMQYLTSDGWSWDENQTYFLMSINSGLSSLTGLDTTVIGLIICALRYEKPQKMVTTMRLTFGIYGFNKAPEHL